MRGKIVVVTGANSGIGKETARGLARQGARVVCVCRDRARGEAAVAEVKAQTGNDAVELRLCDLSSQASIRALSAELHRDLDRIDVLVNNAGVVNPERHTTADGHEATFALNHLGYFLLTRELLDLLKKGAPSRILNLSSHAQRFYGRIDWDDVMGERSYQSMKAYSQSKLANVMFTYELAKRLAGTGVTVNAIHPGAVATGFGSQYQGVMGFFMKVGRTFMRDAVKGAETVVWAASNPELEKETGQYFFDKKRARAVGFAYKEENQRRLWELSEKLTGVTFAITPSA